MQTKLSSFVLCTLYVSYWYSLHIILYTNFSVPVFTATSHIRSAIDFFYFSYKCILSLPFLLSLCINICMCEYIDYSNSIFLFKK